MSQIKECSKKPRPVDEERGRYTGSAHPFDPASASQHKKSKKKREKNSWKNGDFGAVNPKCQGRFLKVTQLSGRLGRGRKIEEIPFFRDRIGGNPVQGGKRSFKLSPASANKIFGFGMVPQGPNKIIKAGEQVRLSSVAVRKNEPPAPAPVLPIQGSIPWQAFSNCLTPQQCPRKVIPVSERLYTLVVVSLPLPQQQQPEKSVPVQSIPETPLLVRAVISRDYQLLERLLRELPAAMLNAQDADGRTVLHHAVRCRDEKAVEQLAKRGNVDLNLQDSDGNTALIISIRDTGNSGTTQVLLAFPGRNNIHLVNKLGQSAVSIARGLGYDALVTQLFNSVLQPDGLEKISVQIEVGAVVQDISSIRDPEKFVPIHRRSSDDSGGSVSYSIATMVK